MKLAVMCAAVLAVALLIGAMTTVLAPSEASASAPDCNPPVCKDLDLTCQSRLCCELNTGYCEDPSYPYQRVWINFEEGSGCKTECYIGQVSCTDYCDPF